MLGYLDQQIFKISISLDPSYISEFNIYEMDYNLVIDRIYETNNYPGLSKLSSLVKKEQPSITSKQIKQWFDAQLELQLLHKTQKEQPTGHIVADVKKRNLVFRHI